MKIAIDAMGGDNAPKVVVEGVEQAVEKFPNITYLLYGNEEQIRQYLTKESAQIQIINTTEEISYDEEPVRAVRKKKDASLVRAAQAVKKGEADALLSAGNTGALLAASILYIGRLKQVERPGLMTTLPTLNDKGVDMLDLGANAESKPAFLNHYAILGAVYASKVRGIKQPKVGLLNNGTEPGKGNEVTKAAYELLQQNKQINFVGNIEAREILTGEVDVVVADGFTGNAVLKSIEGTALTMMKLMKNSVMSSGLLAKLGALLIKPALKKVAKKMDYTDHQGALLMGIKAPVVKSHGSSKTSTILACIEQIETMIRNNVVEQVTTELQSLEAEVE